MENAIVLQHGRLVFRPLRADEEAIRFEDEASALRWLRGARGLASDDRALRSALAAVSPGLDLPRAMGRELLEQASRRLLTGRLRAAEARSFGVLRVVEEGAPPEPVRRSAASKELTWVEIHLVDTDGDPVPNEPFILRLPDGSTHEDTLDAEGRARVEGIPAGQCRVSFPNLDATEWKPL